MKPAYSSQIPAVQGMRPLLFTVTVALLCLVSILLARSAGLLTSMSRIAIYVTANLIFALDAIDLLVRIWLQRLHGAAALGPSTDLGLPDISNSERAVSLRPYALIASIHNESSDIDRFMTALRPFKDRVWLIDDASTDATVLHLRHDGWNCLRGTVNRNKPGALRQLLKALPPEIETVVVMDPDVRWLSSPGNDRAVLERVVGDLQRSDAAALTPRVQARRGGWLVECQALEYELACGIGRKSLGDLACNSGVSVYRRTALEGALARHSLSIYAEDFQNSLLLLADGARIYYDDRLVCETRAKSTLPALISQRVGWSYGCLNLLCERLSLLMAIARRSPLAGYQYLFYLGINGVLLLPLKWISVAILAMSLLRGCDALLLTHVIPSYSWNQPLLFVLWYFKSSVLLLLACSVALRRGERQRHLAVLPFYPFYVLLQYLPITLGYLNVISLAVAGRRIYVDHYEPRGVAATAALPAESPSS